MADGNFPQRDLLTVERRPLVPVTGNVEQFAAAVQHGPAALAHPDRIAFQEKIDAIQMPKGLTFPEIKKYFFNNDIAHFSEDGKLLSIGNLVKELEPLRDTLENFARSVHSVTGLSDYAFASHLELSYTDPHIHSFFAGTLTGMQNIDPTDPVDSAVGTEVHGRLDEKFRARAGDTLYTPAGWSHNSPVHRNPKGYRFTFTLIPTYE